MYRHRTAYALGAIALFSAAALAANARGVRNRVFSSTRSAFVVNSPAEAASIWTAAKVRGRTLLLFDQFPHDVGLSLRPGEAPPPSDLVAYGIFHNAIRRIYLVIPDAEWGEFSRQAPMFHPLRAAPSIPAAQYLFTLSGVPLIAVSLSSLPAIRETALVYVNDGAFDSALVLDLLARKGIRSDVTVNRRRGDSP
jgi:hypothetical protein